MWPTVEADLLCPIPANRPSQKVESAPGEEHPVATKPAKHVRYIHVVRLCIYVCIYMYIHIYTSLLNELKSVCIYTHVNTCSCTLRNLTPIPSPLPPSSERRTYFVHSLPSPCTAVQVAPPPPPPPSPLDPPSELRSRYHFICSYVFMFLLLLLTFPPSLFSTFLHPSVPPSLPSLIRAVSMVIEGSLKKYLFGPTSPWQPHSPTHRDSENVHKKHMYMYLYTCTAQCTHIQSDIENCEGWLSPGGHSLGDRAPTALSLAPSLAPSLPP